MHRFTRFGTSTILAAALLVPSASLMAILPPPPQPDEELLPLLYETLGGDQWHNNDGWLEPGVHWCDWYGVECGDRIWSRYYEFDGLKLPDNNLRGELTAELAELLFVNMAPEARIDLSGNSISGELLHYPRQTRTVDLSDNEMSGPLPPLGGEWVLHDDQRLLLDQNGFSGAIPESWSNARIWLLDLSDNELTSGHHNVFSNASDFVYFTGNPLEGELGREVLTSSITPRGQSNIGGGIDICFTHLTVSDPDVEQWLVEHHTASADYQQCLDRKRNEVDASISGSWYNPERAGEGVSMMMLDTGAPLLYSFSFDTEGNQQWLLEVGTAGDQWASWDQLKETRGTFGQGIAQEDDFIFIRSTARFRFDRVGQDTLNLHRHYHDEEACGPLEPPNGMVMPCPPPLLADRMDYQRLSEQAGTTCNNQSWAQQYAGAWYDPQRDGEGFVVEVLPDHRAVVYWYTYQPDASGLQAWMMGTGNMNALSIGTPPPGTPMAFVDIDPLYQPTGATYGPEFDPDDVALNEWGSLRLEFFRDGSAHVYFESNDPEYGSGDYPLERLARPMLAECEESTRR